MTQTKRYHDEVMAAIHETAAGLYEIGALDKQTMREYDELCLTPVRPLSAEEIRAIREHERESLGRQKRTKPRRHNHEPNYSRTE